MPLKGSLRDFSLPDLFQLIHFGKKNGTLVIANGDSMGYVCFRNGNVFFATNNWKRPALGERLVEAGMVTRRQVDEALELQATSRKDRRVGNILVELGYLKRESLEVFVEENIRDAVFNLLRWSEGDFDFDPDQIFPEEDIGLSMSTEDLIMEGSRRLEEWSRLERKVPSLESIFERTDGSEGELAGMSLNNEERLALDLVDGAASVREMIERSGMSALTTCRSLYGLVTAGVITLSNTETAVGAEAAVAETVEEAGVEEAVAETVEETAEEEAGKETAEEEAGDAGPAQVDEVVVSVEDEEYEEIIVEEAEPSSRRRKKGRRGKAVREREPAPPGGGSTGQDAADGSSAGARAAGDVEAPDDEDDGAAGRPGSEVTTAGPADAPAPGQSLVDYYKALALRELGDSEIYRETEQKAMSESEGSSTSVDYSDEGFTGTIEAEGRAELQQPEDIPMEWSSHLTRLRGRGGKPQPAAQTSPPGEEAVGESTDEGEPGALEFEPEEIVAEAPVTGAGEAPRQEPVTETPVPDEPVTETPVPDEPVTEEAPVEEPADEPFIVPGEDVEEEAGATLLDAELPAEAAKALPEEAPEERAGDLPEVPLLEEELLPTEEEIQRLLQVNPQSRGDLSREELLAFDQPTYPIVESREAAAQVTDEVADQVSGSEAPAPPVAFPSGGGGMGQVLRFGKAGLRQEVEVVLEQPDPLVHSASEERLSVAEDLEVPVFEDSVLEVAAAEEPEPLVESELSVPLVLDEVETLESSGGGTAGQEIEESALEIIGLDGTAELISLDASGLTVAEELEVEEPADVALVAPTAEPEDAGCGAEIDDASRDAQLEGEPRDEAAEGMLYEPEVAQAVIGADIDEAPVYEPATADAGDLTPGEPPVYEQSLVDSSEVEPSAAEAEWIVSGEAPEETGSDDVRAFFEPEAAVVEADASTDAEAAFDQAVEIEETEEAFDGAEAEPGQEESAAAAATSGEQPDEDGYPDDGLGLVDGLQVSGKRGAGTSLVDLETFELEQELLELAGGFQKKQRMPITEKQPAEQDRKKKRAGRSKGKEVDKGSVKKIIDDLKGK